VLYADKLNGRYEAQDLNVVPAGAKSVAAVDLDNDGATDLVVSTASGAFPLFNRLGMFEKGTKITQSSGPLALADLENRGFEDIAVSGAVFRIQGVGRFSETKATDADAAMLMAVDFDGDGRTDLIEVRGDGSLLFLRNETATPNMWLRVKLLGVKNLKLAYGSKIELRAGTHYQKRTYFGRPLLFGMRGYKEADSVRIRWPDGLIQNESHQAANKAVSYKETKK
jgi:hypothetical protein